MVCIFLFYTHEPFNCLFLVFNVLFFLLTWHNYENTLYPDASQPLTRSRPAKKPTTSSSCRRRSWWRVLAAGPCRWQRTASTETWASSLWISSSHHSLSRLPSRASTSWGRSTPSRKTRRTRRPVQRWRRKRVRRRRPPKQRLHELLRIPQLEMKASRRNRNEFNS